MRRDCESAALSHFGLPSVWLWLASTTLRARISTIDVASARTVCCSYYWSTFFTHDDENKEIRLTRLVVQQSI